MTQQVDVSWLKPGDHIRTVEWSLGEVTAPPEDRQWVKVRYLSSRHNPGIVNTEDLCSADDIEELMPRPDGEMEAVETPDVMKGPVTMSWWWIVDGGTRRRYVRIMNKQDATVSWDEDPP